MAERLNRTKTTSINLRVGAEIKTMAVRAAATDRRSLTAYIEKLIEDDVAKKQRSSFPNQVTTQPRTGVVAPHSKKKGSVYVP